MAESDSMRNTSRRTCGTAASRRVSWQWRAIGGLAVIAFVLGCVGFWNYFAQSGKPASMWHIAYVTLQLFTLESGPVPGSVPWQLNVARFLAPVVPAWAVARAILVIFSDQLRSLRAGRLRGHVIVCGLGRKGLHLVESFRDHGERVIAIERDAQDEAVQTCRGLRVPIMAGDATDISLLEKVRADRAEHVVAVTGDDGTNVDIAVLTYQLVRARRSSFRKIVRCSVQVVDLRLSALLERHRILTETRDRFAVSVFNPYRSSARLLLAEHPLDYERITPDDARAAHLVIVGFGQMGESIALQAAQIGCFANGRNLRLSVVDRVATTLEHRFRARHPQVDELCRLKFFEGDVEDPAIIERIRIWADDPEALTTIAICLDDDSRALSSALGILSKLEDGRTPILVRMSDEFGLATLLECEGEQCRWIARVHPFGIMSRVCNRETLLRERLDTLARALHESFVQKRRAEGRPASDSSIRPWDELDEAFKNSNRRAADHIPVKLRAIGCYATPDGQESASVSEFDEREVELLARMEHARWCAERMLAGWTPGEKDSDKHTTPHLVDWNELSEVAREYDREFVRAIPDMLASVGESVYREK